MTWQPVTIPAEFIASIDGGGQQGKKPLAQRLEEARTADDPIAAVMGDHIRFDIKLRAYRLSIEPVPTAFVSEFEAILFKPPQLDVFVLSLRTGLKGSKGPMIVQQQLSASDEQAAMTAAKEELKAFLRTLAGDIARLEASLE